MGCNRFTKNGRGFFESTPTACAVQWKLRDSGASNLRLDVTAAVPQALSLQQMDINPIEAHQLSSSAESDYFVLPDDIPFMNNMDEITYWIYTKRAPCLMNYNNILKKQNDEAHCSKSKPISIHSTEEVSLPKNKKKRKLSLLDDDSDFSAKQDNIFFEGSRKQVKQTAVNSWTSESLATIVDFNIKKSSVQEKRKKHLQKSTNRTIHKKNKVVTSTPKTTINLRRSLRKVQQNTNNNSYLNSSLEIFNSSGINGNNSKYEVNCEQKSTNKQKPALLAAGDQSIESNKNSVLNAKPKNNVLNGQFEDLSDVSGFTANYIRSTKMQSKSPRKLRCKPNRSFMKKSQQSLQKDTKMLVCVNKAVNTGLPDTTVMNCSTDSSQNVINLVTLKGNEKTTKVNRSTSLLKFMDTKKSKSKESVNKADNSKQRRKTNLNVSFQSKSSRSSRYPKRYKKSTEDLTVVNSESNKKLESKKSIVKNSSEFHNSDRKENPEEKSMSKTRSGRSIGLKLRQPENSVLVLSNSTEQVSSMASLNVASPAVEQPDKLNRKKRTSARYVNRSKRSINKSGHSLRDSLRDRSGFAKCFSESDEDNEPLQRRKYFCS